MEKKSWFLSPASTAGSLARQERGQRLASPSPPLLSPTGPVSFPPVLLARITKHGKFAAWKHWPILTNSVSGQIASCPS